MEPLEKLGFALAGYGCTTCIGNSGPARRPGREGVEENDLVVAAVLSGNRNFEGRIHPLVRASYLASPPLVVAFALAGTVDIDLTTQPLGTGADGRPVFLRELWPSSAEVKAAVGSAVSGELFRAAYASVFDGGPQWKALDVPAGDRYRWDGSSTYVALPPFFVGLGKEPGPIAAIEGARVLCVFGDSVTTDHISPAGSIAASSPAGLCSRPRRSTNRVQQLRIAARSPRGDDARHLREHPAAQRAGRSRGAVHGAPAGRRRDHDLRRGDAVRGGERAPHRHRRQGVRLRSSRDWAAKGPRLLGIRAVIAESFERIHRSNLVGRASCRCSSSPVRAQRASG